jgi:hypothetical protein
MRCFLSASVLVITIVWTENLPRLVQRAIGLHDVPATRRASLSQSHQARVSLRALGIYVLLAACFRKQASELLCTLSMRGYFSVLFCIQGNSIFQGQSHTCRPSYSRLSASRIRMQPMCTLHPRQLESTSRVRHHMLMW